MGLKQCLSTYIPLEEVTLVDCDKLHMYIVIPSVTIENTIQRITLKYVDKPK